MNLLTVTDAAVIHIRNQMEKVIDAIGLYVWVKKTGCSGYAFKPEIVSIEPENALQVVTPDGLSIYVANDAKSFLQGVQIDLVTDPTGLKQKKLVFINPNETGRCGCGESFTIE